MNPFSRRRFLHFAARCAPLGCGLGYGLAMPARALAQGQETAQGQMPALDQPFATTHGLSSFGDLALAPGFPAFAYVNAEAPKGGRLVIQLKQAAGNQNFDTFDTLNVFTFKGNGAAGMGACFDSLMAGSEDEPDSVYGLLAQEVAVSADKRLYRFYLRPEACFFDGAPVVAEDAAFSLMLLKTKGHPAYRLALKELEHAEALDAHTLLVQLSASRARDLHLAIATLPIFSKNWWQSRDFEAATLEPPLGSGAYRVANFEPGRFIEFARDSQYWARDLNVNRGQNNFDVVRFEYFRERQVAFEAFKSGALTYNEEYTARLWATAYDFPAVKEGKVICETLPDHRPVPTQGWHFNTRRDKFADPRVREAIGLCFDFEWTNKTIMYGAYRRLTSHFQNTQMMAQGMPTHDELALLEPWRNKLPESVFGEAYVPPVSDGSGVDRALLRKADNLLAQAGCIRQNDTRILPTGAPFAIEFLDAGGALQPHTEPFQQNLRRLGISAVTRLVDVAQYQRRLETFDFDVVTQALSGAQTPGDDLRGVFSSEAARLEGSRNLAGIADPVVDALVDVIAKATTREALVSAARALDRVLRAWFFWVPMWYRDKALIAHWDFYARPQTAPRHGLGAPETWWYDEAKAQKVHG